MIAINTYHRLCHSCESRNPVVFKKNSFGADAPRWIPAFAGMTSVGAGMTNEGAAL